MKRKFLEDLGLEKDQIDKIMAENGNDIELEKAKTAKAETERDGYKTTLDETQEELKKFEGLDIDAQKQVVADLQAKYDTDTKALRDKLSAQQYNHDAEKYLSNVQFSSELARKAALEEFKKQEFKQDGEKFLGADDWIKSMRESSPDAFKATETKPDVNIGIGGGDNNNDKPVTTLNSALTEHYKK